MSDEESWLSRWRGDSLAHGYGEDQRPTLEDIIYWELGDFLSEDGTVEAVLPVLLKILRGHGGALADTLADMIDPEKETRWALELKRKVQGKPPVRGWREDDCIATDYYQCRYNLESEGHATPDKEALSQISASTGLSVETIRQIVKRDRRVRGKSNQRSKMP
jgi:hypothetical protein